jgi:hypothetical protein
MRAIKNNTGSLHEANILQVMKACHHLEKLPLNDERYGGLNKERRSLLVTLYNFVIDVSIQNPDLVDVYSVTRFLSETT